MDLDPSTSYDHVPRDVSLDHDDTTRTDEVAVYWLLNQDVAPHGKLCIFDRRCTRKGNLFP